MTLSVLSEVSQIVASLGVVVSLIFVALEFGPQRGFPATYMSAIHSVLDGGRSNDRETSERLIGSA